MWWGLFLIWAMSNLYLPNVATGKLCCSLPSNPSQICGNAPHTQFLVHGKNFRWSWRSPQNRLGPEWKQEHRCFPLELRRIHVHKLCLVAEFYGSNLGNCYCAKTQIRRCSSRWLSSPHFSMVCTLAVAILWRLGLGSVNYTDILLLTFGLAMVQILQTLHWAGCSVWAWEEAGKIDTFLVI